MMYARSPRTERRRSMERRSTRSDEPEVALWLWLRSQARKQRIEALLIADPEGRLVASSLGAAQSTDLAAIAPRLAQRDGRGRSFAERNGIPMYFRRIRVRKRALLVGAVGRDAQRCRRGLEVVDEGIRRILSEPQPG
jgi:hypothetical protein